MKSKIITIIAMIFISGYVQAQVRDSLIHQLKKMHKEDDPMINVVTMKRIIKDFKLDSVKDAEDLDQLKGVVALSFLKRDKLVEFEAYIKKITNPFNQTDYLNIATNQLLEAKKHPEYAETIALKTVQLYDSYKNESSARPNNFPLENWNRFMKMAAYPYYDTYARVLHINEKDQQALYYQEKAIADIPLEKLKSSSVELYTVLLESQGKGEKAYEILLKRAEVGKATPKMKTLLKQLYLEKNGPTADAQSFLTLLEKNAAQRQTEEISNKMIDGVIAPNFNLLDLNGKRVTLESFRGKVVVLDFWATWCMPCITSMHIMENLTKIHPDVTFLFIATQEKSSDRLEKIRTFINKRKFEIEVLVDEPLDNEPSLFRTVSDYKIEGLPAKIIIDKKGKLRFSSVGFPGEAELISEIEAMINIADKQ